MSRQIRTKFYASSGLRISLLSLRKKIISFLSKEEIHGHLVLLMSVDPEILILSHALNLLACRSEVFQFIYNFIPVCHQ